MEDIVEIGKISIRNKIARSIWNIVYTCFFRLFGTKLFNVWRIFLLKLFGAKIEWDSGVYSSAKIWSPWNLTMGHNAWIGPSVICYNQAMVTLEDDVTVSQYSYLCTAGHRTDILNKNNGGLIVSPIFIEKKAWVAARAYIGPGVTIGEGAVVGATASVYKDVEPWTVVGGNPAKFLKKRVIRKQESKGNCV
jgi:putative colanic acid biosynthesis acetyltransferase WcaF